MLTTQGTKQLLKVTELQTCCDNQRLFPKGKREREKGEVMHHLFNLCSLLRGALLPEHRIKIMISVG